MPLTGTKPSGAAQPCGMNCDTSFVCARRREAFAALGVCPAQSDGLSDNAFEAVLGMLQDAHAAGYRAGQLDVLAQSSTRWAT